MSCQPYPVNEAYSDKYYEAQKYFLQSDNTVKSGQSVSSVVPIKGILIGLGANNDYNRIDSQTIDTSKTIDYYRSIVKTELSERPQIVAEVTYAYCMFSQNLSNDPVSLQILDSYENVLRELLGNNSDTKFGTFGSADRTGFEKEFIVLPRNVFVFFEDSDIIGNS